MTLIRAWRRSLVAAIVVLTALVVVPASSSALTPTPSEAPADSPYCPIGYVCLYEDSWGSWPPVLIPEGESRTFSPPIKVYGLSNMTKLNYCVLSNPSFALGPYQEFVPDEPLVVYATGPGKYCLTAGSATDAGQQAPVGA